MDPKQLPASTSQQKLMDSSATPVPPHVIPKSLAEEASLASAGSVDAFSSPSSSLATPSSSPSSSPSSAIESLASSGSTFVPPGVSTLSSLNSLALTLALRLAPVTVAHAAPSAFQVASFQGGNAGGQLTLDPSQQFPLSLPLQIPHLTGFGVTAGSRHLHSTLYAPLYGQLLEVAEKEEEDAEARGRWWHSTASGVIGGVCCVYAGQPFDTVKVRLQTQSAASAAAYSGPLDCLRKTVSQGGYRALYKGSSAALASVVTENAVLFTAHSTVKDFFRSFNADPQAELSLGQEALAGGVAGFFSSTAITPAEVIKCRLQIQDRVSSSGVANTPLRYSGPLDAAVRIARTEGLRGLFAGLPSVWMRDIPFNFVFLGSYETFCSLATWRSGKAREQLGAAELFVCGGLAGVSGWSIVFPMDVVKSKMQTAPTATPTSALQVIRHTLKTEGPRAFYRGWSAAVLRAFPANAALLMGVELSKRFFEKLD